MTSKKPKITSIKISDELRELLKRSSTWESRRNMMRSHAEGVCSKCDQVAEIKVSYDVSDKQMKAVKVEKFCNVHGREFIKK